jgi:uridine phosphorylase
LNEYVADRVIGSPSLSIKKDERSIGVRIFYRAVTAGGVETNLGLAFVIVKV